MPVTGGVLQWPGPLLPPLLQSVQSLPCAQPHVPPPVTDSHTGVGHAHAAHATPVLPHAPASVPGWHTPPAQQQEVTPEDQTNAETLVKVVRQATAQFQDVAVAEAAGYTLWQR